MKTNRTAAACVLAAGCFAVAAAAQAADGFLLAPGARASFPVPDCAAIDAHELAAVRTLWSDNALEAVGACEGKAAVLALIAPPGALLMTIRLENGQLEAKRHIPVKLPPAEQILGDYLLAHSRAASWEGRLPRGWTLTDEGRKRVLRNPRGRMMETFLYRDSPEQGRGVVSVRNLAYAYRIRIRDLEAR